MITIFNRKELIITYDVQKQMEVRDKLWAAGIEYDVITKNITSPSPFSTGSRGMGTFGINSNFLNEYKIYVKKVDYDLAVKVINTR